MLGMVLREWDLASSEKHPLNYDKVTSKDINRYCEEQAVKRPEWPAILISKDLSMHAVEHATGLQYCFPDPNVGGGDGA